METLASLIHFVSQYFNQHSLSSRLEYSFAMLQSGVGFLQEIEGSVLSLRYAGLGHWKLIAWNCRRMVAALTPVCLLAAAGLERTLMNCYKARRSAFSWRRKRSGRLQPRCVVPAHSRRSSFKDTFSNHEATKHHLSVKISQAQNRARTISRERSNASSENLSAFRRTEGPTYAFRVDGNPFYADLVAKAESGFPVESETDLLADVASGV